MESATGQAASNRARPLQTTTNHASCYMCILNVQQQFSMGCVNLKQLHKERQLYYKGIHVNQLPANNIADISLVRPALCWLHCPNDSLLAAATVPLQTTGFLKTFEAELMASTNQHSTACNTATVKDSSCHNLQQHHTCINSKRPSTGTPCLCNPSSQQIRCTAAPTRCRQPSQYT